MSATLRHQRTIHVDAPVEKVFDYLADPVNFVAGLAADHRASVVHVQRAPDGSVVSFEVTYHEVGRDRRMTVTPEENMDKDVEKALAIHKQGIEALP